MNLIDEKKGVKMGYIRQRELKGGGFRYHAEIRLKGHRTITATFDRKTDAKKWIQKMESNIRCGRHQIYAESKRHTLKEAIERYFKEQKISVVKRGHLLWWQKELGRLFLHDIRPSVISEKKQKLLTKPNAKGVIRSGSTCNRFLATLSHVMSLCCRQWEWMVENPVKKISREKEPQGRVRFLSPEERKRFLKACRESKNSFLYTFVVLLLSTGGRYNEIRFLKWTDIDFINRRITITKSKNSDMRSIPIRGLALKLLQELLSKNIFFKYVFPSKDGKKPLDLRRALRKAIKIADLKNFRAHDCRHSYATEMLAQGLSLGEIGLLLGHRSISQTRRYSHLVESRSIDAISKMTDKVFKEE